jgi:hypothetical protein
MQGDATTNACDVPRRMLNVRLSLTSALCQQDLGAQWGKKQEPSSQQQCLFNLNVFRTLSRTPQSLNNLDLPLLPPLVPTIVRLDWDLGRFYSQLFPFLGSCLSFPWSISQTEETFCTWLISLSVISSRFIYLVTNNRISSFSMAE